MRFATVRLKALPTRLPLALKLRAVPPAVSPNPLYLLPLALLLKLLVLVLVVVFLPVPSILYRCVRSTSVRHARIAFRTYLPRKALTAIFMALVACAVLKVRRFQ